MAASGLVFTSFRPAAIRAEAKPASGGERRRSSQQIGGSASWWTPLFGWPTEADYIDGGGEKAKTEATATASAAEGSRGARRFAAFTEEKARELRMKMMESETFHDAMYHSAIASRLASGRPHRSAH